MNQHVFSKDGQDFEGSYYHRVRPDLELAAGGSWSTVSNATGFNVAAKYHLSYDTNVKAKVTNTGFVSLALQQKICPGKFMINICPSVRSQRNDYCRRVFSFSRCHCYSI